MQDRSESLDLVRGLAALFVMMGHLRSIFFVPFRDLSDKGILNQAFWFATGFGHECVMVFFVLSGFFVGAAYDKGFRNDMVGPHLRNYAINRIVRLWVVLVPALIFTAIIDLAGRMLTASPDVYSSANYFEFIHPSNDLQPLTFVGNIFFLQTLLVPTFGTNTPLWSLANEFWYYLMFPALYLLFARISVGRKLIPALLLVACLGWLDLVSLKFGEGFVIWLMGFAAYKIKVNTGRFTTLVVAGMFLITFALARMNSFSVYTDVTLGVATALLIVAIRKGTLGFLGPAATFLSKISYTLYLVHLPLLIFLSATVLYGIRLDGGIVKIAIFIAMCAAVVAFSYGFYYLFERRTDDVRKWIKGMAGVSQRQWSNTFGKDR